MNTLGKTAVAEQADFMSNFGLYSLIPFAVGLIVMGLIWLFNRSKSAATIKALNTELTKSQSSLNALSTSYDELERDAAEDRRLRVVAEELLVESREARKADSDAAQTMISELRDSPRIDDKAAAIAKKTIEGLEAENGKLAAKLEEAEKVKASADSKKPSKISVQRLELMDERWAQTSTNWRKVIDRKVKAAKK